MAVFFAFWGYVFPSWRLKPVTIPPWFRSPSTHNMSPLVRKLFLHFMPKLMMMRRTQYTLPDYDDSTPSNGYTNEIDVR